jgi:hypothetical protein
MVQTLLQSLLQNMTGLLDIVLTDASANAGSIPTLIKDWGMVPSILLDPQTRPPSSSASLLVVMSSGRPAHCVLLLMAALCCHRGGPPPGDKHTFVGLHYGAEEPHGAHQPGAGALM